MSTFLIFASQKRIYVFSDFFSHLRILPYKKCMLFCSVLLEERKTIASFAWIYFFCHVSLVPRHRWHRWRFTFNVIIMRPEKWLCHKICLSFAYPYTYSQTHTWCHHLKYCTVHTVNWKTEENERRKKAENKHTPDHRAYIHIVLLYTWIII